MARWRSAAIERLPEFRNAIDSAANVMALWIELLCRFQEATRAPADEDLKSRIHAYAQWCMKAPRAEDAANDPPTAVTVAFYEHLPARDASEANKPR